MSGATVLLALALLAALWGLGTVRLARRSRRLRPLPRVLFGAAGLTTIGIALASPLDDLAHERFSAHMLQHMLLVAGAAPAILLANPFPAALWGLPRPVRRAVGRWLGRGTAVRRVWAALVTPAAAWGLAAATLWGWHLPALYDAALAHALVHALEHGTLFWTAVLFWWPVIDPAPRLRRPLSDVARIVYLILAAFQGGLLGLLLALAPRPLYAGYGTTPDALTDQAFGGVLMWALGGAVEMAAVGFLLWRFLAASASSPAHAGPRD